MDKDEFMRPQQSETEKSTQNDDHLDYDIIRDYAKQLNGEMEAPVDDREVENSKPSGI